MVNKTDNESLPNALIKHYWYFIVAWSLIITGILLFGIDQIRNIQHEMAKKEAKSNFNKDQAIRFWSSMHGGVYVPISKETPINPYLSHVKDREDHNIFRCPANTDEPCIHVTSGNGKI